MLCSGEKKLNTFLFWSYSETLFSGSQTYLLNVLTFNSFRCGNLLCALSSSCSVKANFWSLRAALFGGVLWKWALLEGGKGVW